MTAYVELSRVRKLDGLFITHLLNKADCEFFVPPLAVIDELERLDKLHRPTPSRACRSASIAATAAVIQETQAPTNNQSTIHSRIKSNDVNCVLRKKPIVICWRIF